MSKKDTYKAGSVSQILSSGAHNCSKICLHQGMQPDARMGVGKGGGGQGRAMAPINFYTHSLKPPKLQKFFHFQ